MSDYLFMLESHLVPAQRQVVSLVERAAVELSARIYLTGGAVRDMLGGYPITDLDFTVQGDAMRVANQVAKAANATIQAADKNRNTAELLFPGGVTAEIAMSRIEDATDPNQPKVTPASIHEDLLRRDFTVNAIALSLNEASRGLLLDPSNGLSDIESREIRAVSNFSFHNDPVRLLRFIRFRVRLGFSVDGRTQRQYENARAAAIEERSPPRARLEELRRIAAEPNASEIIAALEQEKLMHLFSPALKGSALNLGALAKLDKARQLIPFGSDLKPRNLGLFLYFLTEKLSRSDQAAMAKALEIKQADLDEWQQMESRPAKLGRDLKSGNLHRPSRVYQRLSQAAAEEILFLFLHSSERIVHDRIRNFLQKYLHVAIETTDREVATLAGIEPDSPKIPQYREELILARLDGRKWNPPPPPARPEPKAETAAPPPAPRGRKRKNPEPAPPAGGQPASGASKRTVRQTRKAVAP